MYEVYSERQTQLIDNLTPTIMILHLEITMHQTHTAKNK